MEQEGIDDGIDDGSVASSNERVDKVCSEGALAAEELPRKDSIGGGSGDDALAAKELPERTRTILATHENLMVTNLEQRLMVCA
jgi:hypothetical protein